MSGELRVTGRKFSVGELDLIGLRHARRKHFVRDSEPGQRTVVRQRDGGHGRGFGADQHRARRHRRPPVIAIADVQLRPVEAQTHHRACRRRPPLVGDCACAHQEVVARLPVTHAGRLVVTVRRLAVLIGHDRISRAMRHRGIDGRESHSHVMHVMGEKFAYVLAQHRIDLAGRRQGIQYRRGGDRTGHNWHFGKDQDPLDLPLDIRIEVQGQIRRHTTAESGSERACQQQHAEQTYLFNHGADCTQRNARRGSP